MTSSHSTIAGITNVGICLSALGRIMERTANLPGMALFAGPSGYGKSMAAAYAANQYRAYYVECKSLWRNKDFLLALAREMGVAAKGTTARIMDLVTEELITSRRPLIIDEMDYLVEKKMVNTVRDLYETTQAPILMIGEEQMPRKIKKWERFDGRILEIALAQPASLGDAKELAGIYARDIAIADDLMRALHKASKGSARRVAVNLDRIRDYCMRGGVSKMAMADWPHGFFDGEPPRRS